MKVNTVIGMQELTTIQEKPEVGFIRVTVPTEIIEKKSQDIVNPTDPDLVDARTAKLQPILDELSEVEDQRQTSELRYNRL
jgi:hypothetical protein